MPAVAQGDDWRGVFAAPAFGSVGFCRIALQFFFGEVGQEFAEDEDGAAFIVGFDQCVPIGFGEGGELGWAVKAASTNPAKALGLYDRFGSIEPGKTANLLLLDESLEVKSIFLRGKRI